MIERLLIRLDCWWHSGDPTPSDIFGLLIHVLAFIVVGWLGR